MYNGCISAAAFAILDSSFASSVVSEEAEELDDLAMLFLMADSSKRAVVPKVRVKLFAEKVVPIYSSDDFKSHFRLSRQTTEVR